MLVAARSVAGEAFARGAAPFVVIAPAAIWLASSADAVYAAIAAWSVALAAVAAQRRSPGIAAAAGCVLGLGLLCSYGLALVAIPVAVVLVGLDAVRLLLPVAAGAAIVLAGAALAGFWWVDGLRATVHEYHVLDLERPYGYFLLANVAAFALQLGPATAVALVRLRDRAAWLLVGGGLAAATVANLSGLSEGEVERIWLPFGLLVLLAGGVLGQAGSAPLAGLAGRHRSGHRGIRANDVVTRPDPLSAGCRTVERRPPSTSPHRLTATSSGGPAGPIR